jgi:hypothetical protein
MKVLMVKIDKSLHSGDLDCQPATFAHLFTILRKENAARAAMACPADDQSRA